MRSLRVYLLVAVLFLAFATHSSFVLAQSESEMVSEELGIIIDQSLNEGRELYAEGKYAVALEKFNAVLDRDPGNGEALEYKKLCEYKIDLDERFDEGVVALSAVEREQSNRLYVQGKTLFDAQDLEGAAEKFKKVVEINPLHVPSRRYMEYILMLEREMAERDKEIVESSRVLDVKKAWLPPKKGVSTSLKTRKGDKVKSPEMKLMEEKVNVVIKEINFTEAHLRDVLQYLSKVSGVNIILDEGIFTEAGTISIPKEVTVRETEGEAEPMKTMETISDRITISLKDIPLVHALKYILRTKGLKHRLDEHAIVVSTPKRILDQEMVTRYYHLQSGIGAFTEFQKSVQTGGGIEIAEDMEEDYDLDSGFAADETDIKTITIKDVLEQSGVPFPPASSVFLDKRTSTLIVRNTPDNLTLVEEILERIDIPPFQVEIEAKFVEINQTAMEEMGFEWILHSPLALSKTSGQNRTQLDTWGDGISARDGTNRGKYGYDESGRTDIIERGLSKGVRFWEGKDQPGVLSGLNATKTPFYYPSSDEEQISLGNILSFSGILTDPEFQVIMHALDQTGNANELSAPRVTTVNNQQAQIESVVELRYPSGYEVTPPTVSDHGITPAIVTPTDFITRDVGIILNVTPSVGSDRRTINLTLIPEVSELIGWKDYGSTMTFKTGESQDIVIIQPIFKTKNVTTSVIINDGETIVLGGLISEEVTKIKDKIPVIGDIPLLGRLFRNEGEKSTKNNLMIFVTAKLLDPSGNIIRDN